MPQLVSTAANSSFTEFDTSIPSIGDTADIVEAFRLYHYGKANFVTGETPGALSIYSHLDSLRNDIDELQDKPSAGIVSNEVPHDLDAGAVKVDVPEGFIWLDSDSVGAFDIEQGTVAYSNNEPSEYSHGLIWVDKDVPQTDPFNLDNFLTQSAVDLVYLSKAAASVTYATREEASFKDVEIVNITSPNFQVGPGELYGVLVVSASVATAIIVPADDVSNFPIGSSFSILRTGTAEVTVGPATGATVVGTPGTRLRTIYSFATCLKIAANSWVIIGDTAVA
jgi:hypothetical protein